MQSGTHNRGFASMDRERQREIARKGGRAAHQKGTAHEFTSDEARAAGRKGGERVSADRDHMSRIGRLGGKHSAGRRLANRGDDMEQTNMPSQQPAEEVSEESMAGALSGQSPEASSEDQSQE